MAGFEGLEMTLLKFLGLENDKMKTHRPYIVVGFPSFLDNSLRLHVSGSRFVLIQLHIFLFLFKTIALK